MQLILIFLSLPQNVTINIQTILFRSR